MPPSRCRWGILGTANIARKNYKAIGNSGNSDLAAVASRDRSRAEQFIRECQADVPLTPAPAACASYQELLERKDVDAVYIPLPTGIRKEWVIRAAESGKHVLCEKPCAMNSADLKAMLEACWKNKVQFMDGVMFMHSARLPLMRRTLDEQTIGQVTRITSQFSFKASGDFLAGNIRVSSDLEPLGCLGDLGWYNIRLTLWVMNETLPERVSGRILTQHGRADSGAPVPIDFSGEMFWPGGTSASFYCSFLTQNQQWGIVSGTEGYLRVDDFVLPFFGCESAFEVNSPVFHVSGGDHNMQSHPRRYAVAEYSNSMPDSQETNMIRTFARMVTSGRLEPTWGDIALETQQVLDACLISAQEDGKVVAVTR
jgi:predicted dehydrogenase